MKHTTEIEIKKWQSRLASAIEEKETAERMLRELGAETEKDYDYKSHYRKIIAQVINHLQKNADYLSGPNDCSSDKMVGDYLKLMIDEINEIVLSMEVNKQPASPSQSDGYFTCAGCGHELPDKYAGDVEGYCYLCDPPQTAPAAQEPEVVPPDLGICMECKKDKAIKDYNGHNHNVCEVCYNRLSDEFESEYA